MSDLDRHTVKNDLKLGARRKQNYAVDAYGAAGEFSDEYYSGKGRRNRKEGVYIGGGLQQFTFGDAEYKTFNAGAGVEVSSEKEIRAIAQAETFSLGNDDVRIRGPRAETGYDFSLNGRATAMIKAKAQAGSVSLGPVSASYGVSADTGVSFDDGVEAKILGSGFSIGRKTEFSVAGVGVSVKLW